MAKTIDKLSRIINAFDEETLTKTDFINNFEKVVRLVLDNQKMLRDAIEQLARSHNISLNKLTGDTSKSLTELRKQVDGLFVSSRVDKMDADTKHNLSMVIDALGRLEDKMSKVRDGKDGERGLKGDPGRSPTFEEVSTINAKSLEGFKKEFEEKTAEIRRLSRGRTIAGPSANSILVEDLTSQADGSKRIFVVPNHTKAFFMVSSQAPYIFTTADFTSGLRNVTLDDKTTPIIRGQSLVLLYKK